MTQHEEPKKHPKYPKWAIAWAIISLFVAANFIAADNNYGPDEETAQVIDFVFSFVVTFAFWYGLIVLIGWLYEKVTN